MIDHKAVNDVLEGYVFSNIEDTDTQAEIVERVSLLSDDPNVKVEVGPLDSGHGNEEGFLVEVYEHGNHFEYAIFSEAPDWQEDD